MGAINAYNLTHRLGTDDAERCDSADVEKEILHLLDATEWEGVAVAFLVAKVR